MVLLEAVENQVVVVKLGTKLKNRRAFNLPVSVTFIIKSIVWWKFGYIKYKNENVS